MIASCGAGAVIRQASQAGDRVDVAAREPVAKRAAVDDVALARREVPVAVQRVLDRRRRERVPAVALAQDAGAAPAGRARRAATPPPPCTASSSAENLGPRLAHVRTTATARSGDPRASRTANHAWLGAASSVSSSSAATYHSSPPTCRRTAPRRVISAASATSRPGMPSARIASRSTSTPGISRAGRNSSRTSTLGVVEPERRQHDVDPVARLAVADRRGARGEHGELGAARASARSRAPSSLAAIHVASSIAISAPRAADLPRSRPRARRRRAPRAAASPAGSPANRRCPRTAITSWPAARSRSHTASSTRVLPAPLAPVIAMWAGRASTSAWVAIAARLSIRLLRPISGGAERAEPASPRSRVTGAEEPRHVGRRARGIGRELGGRGGEQDARARRRRRQPALDVLDVVAVGSDLALRRAPQQRGRRGGGRSARGPRRRCASACAAVSAAASGVS